VGRTHNADAAVPIINELQEMKVINVQTAQSCGNLQTVNECGEVAELSEEIQFICRNTSTVLEIIASGTQRWHRRQEFVP
jgi:hypothetical protein